MVADTWRIYKFTDIRVWKATVEWCWWENWRTRRKICLSATLSTSNLTRTDSDLNAGLHSERPVTDHLSHGVVWNGSLSCGLTFMLCVCVYVRACMHAHMHFWGSCTVRNFIICTHPQISLRISNQGEWGGRGMWHVAWERRERCTRFWWESPKERDHSEDQGIDVRMELGWIILRLAGGL
jgi:hypothetical protein